MSFFGRLATLGIPRAIYPVHMKNENTQITSVTSFLFGKAQGGDQVALSDLVTRIEQRLYRFCFFLTKNAEAARDLQQESLVKVLEKIHTIENPDAFVSWLFRVTKNTFINYVRSADHKRTTTQDTLEVELGNISGKYDVGLQIVGAMDQLSAEDRYLLFVVCVEGQSYKEGAELLGLSEDSVRARIYRLRKFIKSQIFTSDLNT